MDFTREPIIETVITPKEGFKLVVRSSKNTAQEEYFVDAVEVVSFGHSFFFRSLERPKSFLVPASDYEVLEVREARMVLKNVGIGRAIKIGGGREGNIKGVKEPNSVEKKESNPMPEEDVPDEVVTPAVPDVRVDKKRDRRSRYRRRRGKEEVGAEGEGEVGSEEAPETDKNVMTAVSSTLIDPPKERVKIQAGSPGGSSTPTLSSLLPPPPNLISETIARYKDNILFKGAFFLRDEGSDTESHKIHETHGTEEVIETDDEQIEGAEEGVHCERCLETSGDESWDPENSKASLTHAHAVDQDEEEGEGIEVSSLPETERSSSSGDLNKHHSSDH